MTRYLSTESLIDLVKVAVGPEAKIRDVGLLESAAARPQTRLFGEDAYETLVEKAAALLHSVVSNHPLVDGNKRLGFVAAATFLSINGIELRDPDEVEGDAYQLIIEVASGQLTSVDEIGRRLVPLLAG
ncbi:type II toxin-antitoxin system death-on-curing family toxin [Glycomyces salinus]|uniref:type II toxin-antitoxin system death-on-curing family toxin n=1 Tax=Glycomyces salinus TaxID=980294 RepID=UPI0018EB4E7B|nr:type II toxin-antitoxin system death-on-curing family toxin [Glycomyces salinus]